MTSTIEHPEGDAPAERGRIRRVLSHRWLLFPAVVFGLAAVAFGVNAWREYRVVTSAKFRVVDYTVPNAPSLVAGSGETVYRIDPTHSSVSYAVNEKLFGKSTHRAKGSTSGIAGEIGLNAANPSASHVGQIVVNVEQLHSDNNLRDARMRASALKSHDYPLANLTVAGLSGMPASIAEGKTYNFTMKSQLTVKKTPAPVTWKVRARVADGKLTARATAVVKMSTFGIGPISISGLVSTSDDVTLTMNLSALDPSKHKVPTEIAAPEGAPRSKDSPSFETEVMPVLAANCASCHNPGQVGAAHWTLETAADTVEISDGIGSVVEAGYMPPWPASPHGVELAGSKTLDKETIATILAWSRAGGQLDVPDTTRILPRGGPTVPEPRKDTVMRMPEAYTGSLNVPNDYRCFVLNPNLKQPMFLTGYQVTPDQRPEIHHVQLFHVDPSQVAYAKTLSGSDGKPGWSCYGTVNLPSTQRDPSRPRLRGFTGQPGLIAAWVPGQDPVEYPDQSGILMKPGDAFVLQMHYHYDTKPIPDRSTVSLQLDPGTSKLKRIDIINPVGPVEIPCMPGVKAALCNRDNAIADDVRLYGAIGAAFEEALLAVCGKTADEVAANFKNGVASTTCDYRVPESGTIVSVFGHEHTLGKAFRFTLDPDTADSKILLDIPNWNFDWQMNYSLAKPLHVEEGQTLRMFCSWDRAIEPNRAPKYIVFAEGTEDEMCFGTYAIIPDDQ